MAGAGDSEALSRVVPKGSVGKVAVGDGILLVASIMMLITGTRLRRAGMERVRWFWMELDGKEFAAVHGSTPSAARGKGPTMYPQA